MIAHPTPCVRMMNSMYSIQTIHATDRATYPIQLTLLIISSYLVYNIII